MAVPARRLHRIEPSREVGAGPGRQLKELLAQSRSRKFVVNFSDRDPCCRATVRAGDVMQAALAYVETFAADVAGREVNVTVLDCETGQRHYFVLGL